MKLLLINPNISADVTAIMAAEAIAARVPRDPAKVGENS